MDKQNQLIVNIYKQFSGNYVCQLSFAIFDKAWIDMQEAKKKLCKSR